MAKHRKIAIAVAAATLATLSIGASAAGRGAVKLDNSYSFKFSGHGGTAYSSAATKKNSNSFAEYVASGGSVDDNAYVTIFVTSEKSLSSQVSESDTITVINDICMENYIQGVLPAEMPSSWNLEALKAQAIAARTYAVANYGKHGSQGFDLVDTQMDQVYNGISAETESSNKAVLETEGIIMTYNNKPITAMYSSSAGGQTHSALESWGNDIPYLQSVPSYDDDVKSFGHGVGMTQHGAKNLANMGNNAYQILSHFYNNIQFARINPIYYK